MGTRVLSQNAPSECLPATQVDRAGQASPMAVTRQLMALLHVQPIAGRLMTALSPALEFAEAHLVLIVHRLTYQAEKHVVVMHPLAIITLMDTHSVLHPALMIIVKVNRR